MSTISRVTTWADGQTLTATALNAEIDNILNDYNGGITNANISGSAAIAYSKLSLSNSIVAGDITTNAVTVAKIEQLPQCKVRKSADQTISNNTETRVTFNTEIFDTHTMHDNSTNPGRITVPTGYGGVYMVTANVHWGSSNTGDRIVRFFVNGTNTTGSDYWRTAPGSWARYSESTILQLNAGDYIELFVQQDSGGDLIIAGGSGTASTTLGVVMISK